MSDSVRNSLQQRRSSKKQSQHIKRKTRSISSSVREKRQNMHHSRRQRVLEELEREKRENPEQNEKKEYEKRISEEIEQRRRTIESILSNDLQDAIDFFKYIYTIHLIKNRARRLLKDTNFCCTQREFSMLLHFTSILKIKFPEMTNRDICTSILYVYYSLNLLEQTIDYMNRNIYSQYIHEIGRAYADRPDLVDNLILEITTGEIPMQINGIRYDIASEIRRFMFGFS